MTFIAAIRRVPGGGFMKAPKSQSLPAVPVHTTFSNLYTYFNAWPKRQSEFLLYGPRRSQSTCVRDRIPQVVQQRKGSGARGCSGGDDIPEHIYGPKMTQPAPSSGDALSSSQSQAAAAAAKAMAEAARSLGLAGVVKRFKRQEKLAMVTAYDFPSARLARGAGVDLILVGDSVGNCRLGLPDTVGVTMDDMLRATTSARRGIDAPLAPGSSFLGPKPVLVGDMPFGSYLTEVDGLKNAAAFRMAGAELVKLEGGANVAPLVRALTAAGVPIMGHIGLLPQSATLQGGLRLQATTADAAWKLVEEAKELASAGAVLLVVECVPAEVGAAVQAAVPDVPVIGIGAGGAVAGQVLVCDDLLGLHGSPPSFVKKYADLAELTFGALSSYAADVRSGTFPAETHMRSMKADELEKLKMLLPGSWSTTAATFVEKDKTKPNGFSANGTSSWSKREMAKHTFTANIAQIRMMAASAALSADAPVVHRTRADLRAWRREVGSVALVPTMGNLHEGHLELVDVAKKHADEVLVSIFVNPAQFAAHEDLDTYPRTMQRDLELLQERGVRAVFAPTPAEMYPRGSPGGTVVVPRFVQGLSEDACRPHFFTGVATVCLKLFNACQPDTVVFGQKDAMQCVVIKRMLEDLCLDGHIEMIIAPTSREEDGLARSSRNSYLTPGMRQRAPAIYASLSGAIQTKNATAGWLRKTIEFELMHEGMVVEYISVADPTDMTERDDAAPIANSVVSIACLLEDGDVRCRLIDNVVVPID
eukprot:TRINITY_DN18233_c0_g1_i1.p1 TRINITY_DN18233_c0_g1~~TRINITY_DN18233_c0_g1_i1.p1  ORF type:complete len:760 (-),score=140.08 TRINITY_DN18233_c0_g1_i1:178-2457(-)